MGVKLKTKISSSIRLKLIILVSVVVFVSNLLLGISSYYLAKKELDNVGKIVLKNGVTMVKEVIKLKNKEVIQGRTSLFEAQESIKEYILGPKNVRGFRPINKNIDLGENGYIFIMDKKGLELAHPSIEGQNTWNTKDMSGEDVYVARELIKAALSGGGFETYYWKMTYSDKIAQKLAYTEYDSTWGWVIVSSAYFEDFNKGAREILIAFYINSMISILLGIGIIIVMARKIIDPIRKVSELSERFLDDNFRLNETILVSGNDEIRVLAESFNKMMVKINEEMKIRVKTQEELENINDRLEIMVEERTIELKRSKAELEMSLTALRETQDYLIRTEKMAALGNLVAGVSHEINTPLGVSVTSISYLENLNNKSIEELKVGNMTKEKLIEFFNKNIENIEIISYNLNRALELISSFKQVAVDQSHDPLMDIDLGEYLEKVLKSLKHEYKRSKHKISINSEGINIRTYPGAISQIVTNFIINSLIHGFEGVEEGLIEINAWIEGEYVLIVYRDNGRGISQENLNKIFDPFFTTRKEKGGSGLGLNIVYNLVTQKLNGNIYCSSNIGEGVEFIVKIPKML